MRRFFLATTFALVCAASLPARSEPSITILPLGFEIDQLRGPSTRVASTVASVEAFREMRGALKGAVAVAWGREGAAALTLEGGAVRIVRAKRGAGDLSALERGRDSLADSRVAGAGALSVQFEMPSRDWPHEGLGSAEHGRVLAIRERKPQPPSTDPKPVSQDVVRIPAGEGAVFEDREPHLHTLGDGAPALLVVRSYRDRGSALAVVAQRQGIWRQIDETSPDGEPFRWLNPIATGERGASRDLALVRRPHVDGVLQVWRLNGDRLIFRSEKAGYSNHVYGQAAQDLAVWFQAADGSSRLAVPTLDRQALALLAVEPELRELSRIPLPGKVKSGVALLGRGADVRFLAGLDDGRLVEVRP